MGGGEGGGHGVSRFFFCISIAWRVRTGVLLYRCRERTELVDGMGWDLVQSHGHGMERFSRKLVRSFHEERSEAMESVLRKHW